MKLHITYKISYHISNTCVVAICEARTSHKFNAHMDRICSDFPWNTKVITKGIVRLKDGDESNIKIAREIAKKKALRTAYREFGNKFYEYANKINYYYAQLIEAVRSSTEISNNLDKDIVDMTRR